MENRIKKETIIGIEKIVNDIAVNSRGDFTAEGRVIYAYTQDEKMSPTDCAKIIENMTNEHITGSNVCVLLKKCYLTPQEKREKIYAEAKEIAQKLVGYLSGEKFEIKDLEKIESQLGDLLQLKRIVLNYIYRMIPQLQNSSSFSNVLKLYKVFAGECIDAIITYIKVEFSNVGGMEAYEKEIFRLESELLRSNRLLVRLQDDFDERIEENRKQECESLISLLNSAKYGYILDLLTNLQYGIRKLRRAGKQIPLEIGSLQSLVRQLLQFVEDCGITPIMEIGEELTVKANEIDNYNYQGTPFNENEKEKNVIVISAGWEIKDKELTISLPTVQEKE